MLFTSSLKKNYQFRSVYKKGKSIAGKYIVAYVYPNGLCENRLGVSVSKKVGNSVIRHRLTRLIKEGYRLEEGCFGKGYDIVIVSRKAAVDACFKDIKTSLCYLLKKLGISLGA